jgi:acetoin utilization protein AcuB
MRLAMIVGMYMTRDVETISPETSLIDAIRTMSRHRIRRLVVTDKGKIVGMVGHRDLANAFPDHINPFSPVAVTRAASAEKVRKVMTYPVITIGDDKPIEQAARLMTKHRIGSLPVTCGGKLVGIITESDIFRALTGVLSESGDSIRITFDLTESENVLSFLAEAAQKYGLALSSFITFHDGDRRMAVASVRGRRAQDLVDELWESGHRVVSVLRPTRV